MTTTATGAWGTVDGVDCSSGFATVRSSASSFVRLFCLLAFSAWATMSHIPRSFVVHDAFVFFLTFLWSLSFFRLRSGCRARNYERGMNRGCAQPFLHVGEGSVFFFFFLLLLFLEGPSFEERPLSFRQFICANSFFVCPYR